MKKLFIILFGIFLYSQSFADGFCTMDYTPVCGKVQVQCIKAPCDPVYETFGNKCMLNANSNATFAYSGECSSTGINASVGMANPASTNCTKVGGNLEIKSKPDGSQYGVCLFEENRQCEEWALFNGKCAVGGKKLTGYIGEYAKYCAITGNTFTNKGQDSVGDDIGTCDLGSGVVVDAKNYYLSGDTTLVSTGTTKSCTKEYNPVCGQPKMPSCASGTFCIQMMPAAKTYSNTCMMESEGASFVNTGSCASNSVIDANETTTDTKICTMEYAPICGVDGKTYGNSCTLGDVKKAYSGECLSTKNTLKVKKALDKIIFGKTTTEVYPIFIKALERIETLKNSSNLTTQKISLLGFVEYYINSYLEKYIK